MNTIVNESIVVLCLLGVIAVEATDGTENIDGLPSLAPKVKTIAVFKNGLGFVFKSGETHLKDGWAELDRLPSGVLGALWIGSTSQQHPVTEVVSRRGKVTEAI